eukprot:1569580-Amphidinium_carterae.1
MPRRSAERAYVKSQEKPVVILTPCNMLGAVGGAAEQHEEEAVICVLQTHEHEPAHKFVARDGRWQCPKTARHSVL